VGAAIHPLLADAARFTRRVPGGRWFVDETYVKVNGVWRYVYRAVDQHGQVIDVLLSARRDAACRPPVLTRALRMLKVIPSDVVTDAAPSTPACSISWCPRLRHRVVENRAGKLLIAGSHKSLAVISAAATSFFSPVAPKPSTSRVFGIGAAAWTSRNRRPTRSCCRSRSTAPVPRPGCRSAPIRPRAGRGP
jgi:transposase-like protein